VPREIGNMHTKSLKLRKSKKENDYKVAQLGFPNDNSCYMISMSWEYPTVY